MKKLIIVLFFLLFVIYKVKANFVIPSDAIRLRVIANSNSDYDQAIKMKVKDLLEYKMYNLLKNTKGVNEARKIIGNNIDNINEDVKKLLYEENYLEGFKINYGSNYFPEKKYKGITYKEGYYESLVITLGEGKGDNWWCVLFPPLCLIEADESKNVEYKSFVKEMFDKYFS